MQRASIISGSVKINLEPVLVETLQTRYYSTFNSQRFIELGVGRGGGGGGGGGGNNFGGGRATYHFPHPNNPPTFSFNAYVKQ